MTKLNPTARATVALCTNETKRLKALADGEPKPVSLVVQVAPRCFEPITAVDGHLIVSGSASPDGPTAWRGHGPSDCVCVGRFLTRMTSVPS